MHDEFLCPGCRIPLRQMRMDPGIFWACPQCGGRALNVELLRRTFTDESINPFWLHAIRGQGKTGRDCPCCRHSMIEVPLADDPGAPAIDVCRSCHFVWFDASEIGELRPKEIPPSPGSAADRRARELAHRKNYRVEDPPMNEWWQQLIRFLTQWIG
jgi:Zn-finger nucleic acid-binding protein